MRGKEEGEQVGQHDNSTVGCLLVCEKDIERKDGDVEQEVDFEESGREKAREEDDGDEDVDAHANDVDLHAARAIPWQMWP